MEEKEINSIPLNDEENQDSINFIYLIGILFRYWKILFGVTFVVGAASIIYVLVVTPIYKSYVTMYPVTKDQGGPLKELAVTLGMASKNDGFYLQEVLKSRRISAKVIYSKYLTESFPDSINLIKFFGFDKEDASENRKFEATLNALKGSVEIKEDKETGLVNIQVLTKDKKLCHDICVVYTEAVTRYLQVEQKNQVSQSINFTSERLEEVREELSKAEQELIDFQEKNIRTTSPALSTEVKRMYKKIEIIQNVVIMLEKQLELLKIEEVRDRSVVNILDKADIYDKPFKPQKRKVVIANTFISFFLLYALVILREKIIYYKIIPAIRKESKRK